MEKQTDNMKDLLEKDLLGQVHSAVEYFDKVSDFNKSQPAVKAKQTAVEWLINEIDMQFPSINIKWKEWMIDRARQIEERQIIEARADGISSALKGYAISNEEYYNETYVNK